MNESLTDKEKKLVALALQGLAMRISASEKDQIFTAVVEVCRKVGATEYLTEFLKSWIAYAEDRKI